MNTNHLNHQQLCDLLIDTTPDAASSAHLAECAACSSEFASLNASLGVFRQASILLADRNREHRPVLVPKRRSTFAYMPAYAAAAAALAVAIMLPLRNTVPAGPAGGNAPVQAQPVAQQPVVESKDDEALLEELDQDVAASIPAPMQPLANPNGVQGNAR